MLFFLMRELNYMWSGRLLVSVCGLCVCATVMREIHRLESECNVGVAMPFAGDLVGCETERANEVGLEGVTSKVTRSMGTPTPRYSC